MQRVWDMTDYDVPIYHFGITDVSNLTDLVLWPIRTSRQIANCLQ